MHACCAGRTMAGVSCAAQAIQKGSVDSCKEAHQDWLAKVQAALAAPAHVLPPSTPLVPLRGSYSSYSSAAQVSTAWQPPHHDFCIKKACERD